MKHLYSCLFLTLVSASFITPAHSQLDHDRRLYLRPHIFWNPAYLANNGQSKAVLSHTAEHLPPYSENIRAYSIPSSTDVLSLEYALSSRHAIGLSSSYKQYGKSDNFHSSGINTSVAYRYSIPLLKNSKASHLLHLGASVGLFYFQVHEDVFGSPYLHDKAMVPDLNSGIWYDRRHKNSLLYAGMSLKHLSTPRLDIEARYPYRLDLEMPLNLGYRFPLSADGTKWLLEPSIFANALMYFNPSGRRSGFYSTEINTTAIYRNKVKFGASYRIDIYRKWVANAGFIIAKKFELGLSVDLNRAGGYTRGAELRLYYLIGQPKSL